jgi:hypothetical protein
MGHAPTAAAIRQQTPYTPEKFLSDVLDLLERVRGAGDEEAARVFQQLLSEIDLSKIKKH